MSVVAATARPNPPGPLTVTAAFGPAGSPLTVTSRLPVVAVQATANVAVTVSTAATVTSRGFCPCAWQLAARPASWTLCFLVRAHQGHARGRTDRLGVPPSTLTV